MDKFKCCIDCEYHNSNPNTCKSCEDADNYQELYNADPDCIHDIVSASGGGIRCTKCNGWFCY